MANTYVQVSGSRGRPFKSARPDQSYSLAGSLFQIEQLFTGSLVFGELGEHFENPKRNVMDCLSRGFSFIWSVVVKNNSVWPSSLAMTGKKGLIGRYPFIVLFCYNSSGEYLYMKHKRTLLILLLFAFLFLGFFFRDREETKVFFGFDTWIEVELPRSNTALFSQISSLVTQLDQLWNRFSPSSIIFKVNHSSLPLLVDEDTFQVLEAAQEGREKTQGFFNILITPPDFDTFC